MPTREDTWYYITDGMHIVDAQEKQRKRPGVADDRKHTFFNNNKKKSKTSAAFSPG